MTYSKVRNSFGTSTQSYGSMYQMVFNTKMRLPARTVIVEIDPKAKKIQITDNGRGMRMLDLHRYFQMHGENLDRKQGRPGRGFFGTGKSAAFGIASELIITAGAINDARKFI